VKSGLIALRFCRHAPPNEIFARDARSFFGLWRHECPACSRAGSHSACSRVSGAAARAFAGGRSRITFAAKLALSDTRGRQGGQRDGRY